MWDEIQVMKQKMVADSKSEALLFRFRSLEDILSNRLMRTSFLIFALTLSAFCSENNTLQRPGDYYWLSKQAKTALEVSSKEGNADASYRLGEYYWLYSDDSKGSIKWFTLASSQGHVLAPACLGRIFDPSDGGDDEIVSEVKSFKWHLIAANRGVIESQTKVGDFYLNGVGVKKNERHSREWFLRAGLGGHSLAWGKLIAIYKNEKNWAEMLKWIYVSSFSISPKSVTGGELEKMHQEISLKVRPELDREVYYLAKEILSKIKKCKKRPSLYFENGDKEFGKYFYLKPRS